MLLEIKKGLKNEAERLRRKYNPKSVEDLERIAKEEYGIKEVVATPLVYDASMYIRLNNDDAYILYYATFKPYGPLVLAHEMGHHVAKHRSDRWINPFLEEEEADYFSMQVNGFSSEQYAYYELIEGLLGIKAMVYSLLRKKAEIIKLKKRGLGDLLMKLGYSE